MFPSFLLWPRAPSWLPLAHCFPAWLWSIGLDNYLWGQWAVCTLSCSDANSTSNSPVPFLPPCVTQLSSYDPLMDRPVICCWKLLYCRGADRSAISVEESLPVRFAKSLTETFTNKSRDWHCFLIYSAFSLGSSTLIFRESIYNPKNTWYGSNTDLLKLVTKPKFWKRRMRVSLNIKTSFLDYSAIIKNSSR